MGVVKAGSRRFDYGDTALFSSCCTTWLVMSSAPKTRPGMRQKCVVGLRYLPSRLEVSMLSLCFPSLVLYLGASISTLLSAFACSS